MLKLIEALRNADIPAPNRDTETFHMVRWGKNNRYWLRKFEGGYVFGDFVSGLSTYVFDKAENEYTKAELKEKLRLHDYPEEAADRIIGFLVDTTLVDDYGFAYRYLYAAYGNRSLRRLEGELARRFLPKELIRRAEEAVCREKAVDSVRNEWIGLSGGPDRNEYCESADDSERDKYTEQAAAEAVREYNCRWDKYKKK